MIINKKDISIVLGSYNRKKYLKLTIDSIRKELDDSRISNEIIVVDGGSDDGSLKWLLEQKDIITIVQHNRGVWQGREIQRRSWGYFMNLGFKVAQGKYICMLSDDCLVIPGAIKNGFNYFEEQLHTGRKVGAVAFYWRDWPKFNFYYVGLIFGKVFVNHGMYLKSALETIGYIDEEFHFYHADGDLCLKLWNQGYECIACPDSYIEHYSHANQIVRQSNNAKLAEDYERLLSKWNTIFFNKDYKVQQLPYISLLFDDKTRIFEKFINPYGKLKIVFKEVIKNSRFMLKLKRIYKGENDNTFNKFEKGINKKTWRNYDLILKSAFQKYNYNSELRTNPISRDYNETDGRSNLLKFFYLKYNDNKQRILIHMPKAEDSPGGYSLFNNLYQSLNYIGIQTEFLYFGEPVEKKLSSFNPTCLLTSDNESWLSWINWQEIIHYREQNNLKIGMTASLEQYGNTPLLPRLKWANKMSVDFFYSFRSRDYINSRFEYKAFTEEGFPVLNVEFGANPLLYYPIKNVERDIDYVFLGSSNSDKQVRYGQYFTDILRNYTGFIHGPGWSNIKQFRMNTDLDKYIYARAKVGLNLHIDEQIVWPCELNERTYMLAACKVPQLIDNPALLLERFSSDCFFIAKTPKEYNDLFCYILEHPDEAEKRAEKAYHEVLDKHTTFHRADSFIQQLLDI